MRPFDYLPGQSMTFFRHKKGATVSPDDRNSRFLILSASHLQLPLEALPEFIFTNRKLTTH